MFDAEIKQFQRDLPHAKIISSQRFTFCESWLILAKNKKTQENFSFWRHPERDIFKFLAQGSLEHCQNIYEQTLRTTTANIINHKVSSQIREAIVPLIEYKRYKENVRRIAKVQSDWLMGVRYV